MALPTAEEITNLYLYGTRTKPANLLDPSLFRNRPDAAIDVNINEYMTQGAGRFIVASDFDWLGDFFSEDLPPGTYTKNQVLALLGHTGAQNYYINQLFYDTGSADYAERV